MRRHCVQTSHPRRSQWQELFLQVRSVSQTILSARLFLFQWPRLGFVGTENLKVRYNVRDQGGVVPQQRETTCRFTAISIPDTKVIMKKLVTE
jgi:hypothetical protein